MSTPEEIARKIVDRFSWSSNVMYEGRLVGEQYVVAIAIAEAIKAERDKAAPFIAAVVAIAPHLRAHPDARPDRAAAIRKVSTAAKSREAQR